MITHNTVVLFFERSVAGAVYRQAFSVNVNLNGRAFRGLPGQDCLGDRGFQLPLYGPLQRTGAVDGIPTDFCEPIGS